jgi:hypothetical protein
MRILLSTLVIVCNVVAALAHPSVVPHQHPHAASALPDALALLLAALLVGFGFVALRRLRKE